MLCWPARERARKGPVDRAREGSGGTNARGRSVRFAVGDLVTNLRAMRATPHLAQNVTGRRSAIDGRTIRHVGYRLSWQKRKLVEHAKVRETPQRIARAK